MPGGGAKRLRSRRGRCAATCEQRARTTPAAPSRARWPRTRRRTGSGPVLDELRRALGVGLADAVRRAERRHRAGAAGRLAGVAGAPAVEDHPVRQHRPVALARTARATSCSTTTGSSLAVQPNRRESRPKWVSTVIPGMPKALPSTTLAVLRPTPGSVTSSLEPARHLAAEVRRPAPAPSLTRVSRLRPEEPGRLDQLLELGAVGRGVVGRASGSARRGRASPG